MLKCFCEDPLTVESNAEHWYATNCGHVFHFLCLTNWLERSKTCPQCREPVRTGQMFRLYPTAWDEKPKDEINEALQTCLDTTQTELDAMTALCKKKDDTITSLKGHVDNHKNFRRENDVLKDLLQTLDGEHLDNLFDDPKHFDLVLNGKVALIELQELAQQAPVAPPRSEASATHGAGAPPRTEASNINNTPNQPRNMLQNINTSTPVVGSSAPDSQGRRELSMFDAWPQLRPTSSRGTLPRL